MKPSRADHDDAIKAYAAIRTSCCGIPERGGGRAFKNSLIHDLGALNKVVTAYAWEQRISRTDYGEYLRVLVRWLADGQSLVEVQSTNFMDDAPMLFY